MAVGVAVVLLLVWFLLIVFPVGLLGAPPVLFVPPVLVAPPVVTIAVVVVLGISGSGSAVLLAADITA